MFAVKQGAAARYVSVVCYGLLFRVLFAQNMRSPYDCLLLLRRGCWMGVSCCCVGVVETVHCESVMAAPHRYETVVIVHVHHAAQTEKLYYSLLCGLKVILQLVGQTEKLYYNLLVRPNVILHVAFGFWRVCEACQVAKNGPCLSWH